MAGIVLVDDHLLVRKSLATMVKNLGYTILFEAENGEDLIRKLQVDQLPQVVMLDINMPLMNGYETAAWLRKNHPSIKILALSVYDNKEDVEMILHQGADSYILKDSDPLDIKAAIEHLLSA